LELLRTFSPWEPVACPDRDTSDFLMFLEPEIGEPYDLRGGAAIVEHQDGMHPVPAHYCRFAHAGHSVQHALYVFGKNLEPFGSSDHFLLSATNRQTAGFIETADVTGAEPAVLKRLGCLCGVPIIAGGHALAAHQDL